MVRKAVMARRLPLVDELDANVEHGVVHEGSF
jgi:hypothetical protein